MDRRTDQALVLEFQPRGRVVARRSPITWVTEYRAGYALAPGEADPRHPWCSNPERAWRAACARLGLRALPGG